MKLYTDGAYSPKSKVGAFAVIRAVFNKTDICIAKELITDNPTANIAELKGLIAALEYVLERKPNHATIYCDSQYAVKTFNSWIDTWHKKGWRRSKGGAVKNIDLIRKLFQLKKDLTDQSVNVVWVKGHNGNNFNEVADGEAKALVSYATSRLSKRDLLKS